MNGNLDIIIGQSHELIPIPGEPVTILVRGSEFSKNGSWLKPLVGYRVIIEECNRQVVTISAVDHRRDGDVWLTFAPDGTEVIDLTKSKTHTVIFASIKEPLAAD